MFKFLYFIFKKIRSFQEKKKRNTIIIKLVHKTNIHSQSSSSKDQLHWEQSFNSMGKNLSIIENIYNK